MVQLFAHEPNSTVTWMSAPENKILSINTMQICLAMTFIRDILSHLSCSLGMELTRLVRKSYVIIISFSFCFLSFSLLNFRFSFVVFSQTWYANTSRDGQTAYLRRGPLWRPVSLPRLAGLGTSWRCEGGHHVHATSDSQLPTWLLDWCLGR